MTKGNKPTLRDQRVRILETILKWERQIENSRLRSIFGLTTVQASRMLAEFRQFYEDKLENYIGETVYRLAPKAKGLNDSTLDDYAQIVMATDSLSRTIMHDGRLDLSRNDPVVFAAIRKAALTGQGVVIRYASMTNPEPADRLVFPHAIVHAGRRWHARAWCEAKKSFRDFAIGRIYQAALVEEKGRYLREEDEQWNTMVSVKLSPHRQLSAAQQRLISDENLAGEMQMTIELRQCLASYVIQDLRATMYPEKELPPAFQLEAKVLGGQKLWG